MRARLALDVRDHLRGRIDADWRDVEVAVKKASQLRIAKAWPVADEPAFMISGRVPP